MAWLSRDPNYPAATPWAGSAKSGDVGYTHFLAFPSNTLDVLFFNSQVNLNGEASLNFQQ